MSDRRVSVIVPAFNETNSLQGVVHDITRAAEVAGLDDFEIVIVDDGSTDGTAECAAYIASQCDWVSAVQHRWTIPGGSSGPINRGLRDAYESGLAVARMPYVTWVPGDGEMARASIADILRAVGSADLVVPYHGTPERRTWFRRLLTWVSTTQLNLLLGHRLHYFQGTVVYPTAMAKRLPRTEPGFFCMAEMLAWALEEGPTYVEVPLVHTDRAHGHSKAVGLGKMWAAQQRILRVAFRIHAERLALMARYTMMESRR